MIVTRDEIRGLMAGLLCVDAPAAGATALTEWVEAHADTLGPKYSSELARRKDRASACTGRIDRHSARGHGALAFLALSQPIITLLELSLTSNP